MKISFAFSVFFLINIVGLSQNISYNKNYSIACHNCYELQYSDSIEKVLAYTSTIEFDIWDNKINSGAAGSDKMDKDWYVKHEFYTDGNLNCCGGTFKNCLNRIKIWSDNNQNHNIITVFIDKKENWSDPGETRNPNDLDQLLLSIFSREKIFTPTDLLKGKQDLKVASSTNWPSLDSLKGKFVFVITDATVQLDIPWISPLRTPLNEYLEAQKSNAVCFVAPEITTEGEINLPKGFSNENAQNVVFYNLKYGSENLSDKIDATNCLSRIYDSPEDIKTYNDLVNRKINFIAMHNFKLLK